MFTLLTTEKGDIYSDSYISHTRLTHNNRVDSVNHAVWVGIMLSNKPSMVMRNAIHTHFDRVIQSTWSETENIDCVLYMMAGQHYFQTV